MLGKWRHFGLERQFCCFGFEFCIGFDWMLSTSPEDCQKHLRCTFFGRDGALSPTQSVFHRGSIEFNLQQVPLAGTKSYAHAKVTYRRGTNRRRHTHLQAIGHVQHTCAILPVVDSFVKNTRAFRSEDK